MSIGYTTAANPNIYTGYDDYARNQVISAIIEKRLTPALERIADTRAFTWYDFSDEQKRMLRTGGRASVITNTFGAWVKDTLKLLQNEAKAVQPKYRGEYFSGLLCIKWNGETGGSIVFVSDAGIVSEPFKSVNVGRAFDARITDFKALADWMKTLQPDRLDIIGYRNNYARFDYAPVSSERPTYNYFGQIRSGKPVASAAFGPMSLLWKSEGLTE